MQVATERINLGSATLLFTCPSSKWQSSLDGFTKRIFEKEKIGHEMELAVEENGSIVLTIRTNQREKLSRI
jgi:hypothetical protein